MIQRNLGTRESSTPTESSSPPFGRLTALLRKHILPIMIAVAAAGLISSAAPAQVTTSGDVYPTNPTTWNSSIASFIGYQTGNGTLTIAGGSTVTSAIGYLGYSAGLTGTVMFQARAPYGTPVTQATAARAWSTSQTAAR